MTPAKRKRGGQWRVDPVVMEGRAYENAMLLKQIWGNVSDAIIGAETPDDVTAAFETFPYFRERLAVGRLPALILMAVRDRDFPKLRANCQIEFIADSIAAGGAVCIARSRQVCRIVRKNRIQELPDLNVGAP